MLEIAVSLLYFTNKIFLYLEKKAGWGFGIAASSLATVYFLYLKLYIFLSLEFACLTIMILGFLGNRKTTKISYAIYGVITLVMIYLLINVEVSGWTEFITSLLFIVAFLLLAHGKWNLGWLSLGGAHILMLTILLGKNQEFFALMQGLSVGVCILAVLKRLLNFNLALGFKK